MPLTRIAPYRDRQSILSFQPLRTEPSKDFPGTIPARTFRRDVYSDREGMGHIDRPLISRQNHEEVRLPSLDKRLT